MKKLTCDIQILEKTIASDGKDERIAIRFSLFPLPIAKQLEPGQWYRITLTPILPIDKPN